MMAISINANPVDGFLRSRINRMIDTNKIGAGDALLFGVVGALGLIPDSVGGDGAGPNRPLYSDEPSTWCNHCRQQYWGARCNCGRV